MMHPPQPAFEDRMDVMPQEQPIMPTGAEMDNNMMDEGYELDPEFLAEIETYLKECMENNEVSIDMSDTLIKDHGAKMVAAAASLCDQLQELRLQQCGITDDGAMELFTELQDLQQLQVIDLSFNPISEKSLDKLTALLMKNQNLVVNMRMNAIKNKFAARKMQHFEQQGRLNI
jgi:Ran GTPase-activating protein (RanGAP) involved in mRNA processing and transport